MVVVAVLMIVFGLAEIVTGLTHSFFGIVTAQGDLTTYAGILLGAFYFISGLLVLSRKKWAAGLAIALLCADILGRVAMVLMGLYPVNSFRQTFAILAGTTIAAVFALYIGLKWKTFK